MVIIFDKLFTLHYYVCILLGSYPINIINKDKAFRIYIPQVLCQSAGGISSHICIIIHALSLVM